jgi:rhodanese-related sulfurtransferase
MHMFESRMSGRSNRLAVMSARVLCVAFAAIGVVAGAAAGTDASVQQMSKQPSTQLPAEKQTKLGLYVTAKQAYDQWRAAPDQVKIIDVRTPEEYMWVGHAPMAWLVPVIGVTYQWDPGKKQFPVRPLPDFIARMQKIAQPGDTLLVMCRSGGRAAAAINLLADAGYTHVYNITDGMEGDPVKDPESLFKGQRLVNGWKNAGLPWTYDIDPARLMLPAAH